MEPPTPLDVGEKANLSSHIEGLTGEAGEGDSSRGGSSPTTRDPAIAAAARTPMFKAGMQNLVNVATPTVRRGGKLL